MNQTGTGNPLGTYPVNKLLVRFAIPSIVAMLVGALYNIVDQFFIGRTVGPFGNAATTVAFPLTMCCTAIALLFGIGGASCFNLNMGRGNREEAPFYVGNSVFMLVTCGLTLCLVSEVFLNPMMQAFGASANVLPYALTYVRITAAGFPCLILVTGGGHLIRADGSPNMSMFCNLSGAVLNAGLDALFTMGLGWGIAGAAWATVIGQAFSAALVINYMRRYKTVPLGRKHLRPRKKYVLGAASIGAASCINQFAMMSVQITSNNLLKKYGALSVYGSDIPIACAGIVSKVNQVFFSVVIGIAQGSQPIESFNYGARNYDRVRKTYRLAVSSAAVISIASFVVFQLFPRSIIALFGDGSKEYFDFGVRYFRIFLFFIFLNCLQPITTTFFTSIGKPKKGAFLSLTRQILFLLPLMLILPLSFGIDGILYAGPAADALAAIATVIMAALEFKNMRRLSQQQL